MRNANVRMAYGSKKEEVEKITDYFTKDAQVHFTKFENWLKLHGTDYFAGPKPSVCDFHIWEMCD